MLLRSKYNVRFCGWGPHDHRWNKIYTTLSGLVYFKNTQLIKELIQTWINDNDKDHSIWDQVTLQNVVDKTYAGRLKIQVLPTTYAKIRQPYAPADSVTHDPTAVIGQKQRSREYKEKV